MTVAEAPSNGTEDGLPRLQAMAQIQQMLDMQAKAEDALRNLRQIMMGGSLRVAIEQLIVDGEAAGNVDTTPRQKQQAQPGDESTLPDRAPGYRSSILSLDDDEAVQSEANSAIPRMQALLDFDGGESDVESQRRSRLAPSLPPLWPASLRLRRAAVVNTDTASTVNYRRSQKALSASLVRTRVNADFEWAHVASQPQPCQHGWRRWCCSPELAILDPFSLRRAALDIVMCIVWCVEGILVPLRLGWDQPIKEEVELVFQIAGIVSWTSFVLANFLTGYYSDGEVVMELPSIARHYIMTWFPVDFVAVVVEMANTVSSSTIGEPKSLPRLFQLVRLCCLLLLAPRVLRVPKIFEVDMSAVMRGVVRFGWLLLALLWMNHLGCCIWMGIAHSSNSDTGLHWTLLPLATFRDDLPTIGSQDMWFQYATAYHWSIAQITLGAMDVLPLNTLERMVTVIWLIVGFAVGSTMISFISSTMMEAHLHRRDYFTKLRTLREFMRQNNVDRKLGLHVQQKVEGRIFMNTELVEKDVEALDLLPSALNTALRFNLVQNHLQQHPMFRSWMSIDLASSAQLGVIATQLKVLHQGDYLFEPAAKNNGEMFCCCGGKVQYTQEPSTSPVDCVETTNVAKGVWLCEPSMWIEDWIHVGLAEACQTTKVLSLKAEKAFMIIQRHHIISHIIRDYAARYYEGAVKARPPLCAYPSDLGVPFTEFDSMLASMKPESQQAIGLAALERMMEEHHRKRHTFMHHSDAAKLAEGLHNEVFTGASLIMLDDVGEAIRVVSVVTVCIKRSDGRMLVQIAKASDKGPNSDAEWEAACKLPGGKLLRGERPADALRRLEERFPPCAQRVTYTQIERQVRWNALSKAGLRTKYLKFVCHASADDDKAFASTPFRRLVTNGRSIGRTVTRSASVRSAHTSATGDTSMTSGMVMSVGLSGFIDYMSSNTTNRQLDVGVFLDERLTIRKGGCLYAWVTREDFEKLDTEAGETALKRWLSEHYITLALNVQHHSEDDEEMLGNRDGDDDVPSRPGSCVEVQDLNSIPEEHMRSTVVDVDTESQTKEASMEVDTDSITVRFAV